MSSLSDSAQQWWAQRDSREKKILGVFGVFLVCFGLYAGIFKPVVGGYLELQRQYQQADIDYRWLQDQIVLLNRLKAESGGILPVALSAADLKREIEEDFDTLKISADINILTEGDKDFVEIYVEGVAGTKLMHWLEKMSQKGRGIRTLDLDNNTGQLSGAIVLGQG